jgi:hypothetical protein
LVQGWKSGIAPLSSTIRQFDFNRFGTPVCPEGFSAKVKLNTSRLLPLKERDSRIVTKLHQFRLSSLCAARIFHEAVSAWLLVPESVELGNACLLAARAYRDKLYDQLDYLLSREGMESADENVAQTMRLIEIISAQIEIGFKF